MGQLVFIALLAACGSTDSGSDAAIDAAASTCATSCPVCDAGSVCVTGMHTGSVCLKTCETGTDCPAGLQCSILQFIGGTLLSPSSPPRVCVSPTYPAECEQTNQGTCSDYAFVTCIDAQHLGTGFTSAANESCGSTITTCPKGCQSDVDAGIQGIHAGHCL